GEPPLVDGAVLSLQGPADPDRDVGVLPAGSPDASARLHVVAGPDAGGVHLLHGGRIDIGRSAHADVPLDDPDVSRLHCAVTVTDEGRVTVADLGSTNGTTLDGTTVLDHPVPFPSGSLLRVGESTLGLRVPTAAPDLSTATLPATPDGEGHLRVTPGAFARDDHWPDNTPAETPDPGTPARGTHVPPGVTATAPTVHGTGFGQTGSAAPRGTQGQGFGPGGPLPAYGPGSGPSTGYGPGGSDAAGAPAGGTYGSHGQGPGAAGYSRTPGGPGAQAGAYEQGPVENGTAGYSQGSGTGGAAGYGQGPGSATGGAQAAHGRGQRPGASGTAGYGQAPGGATGTPGVQAAGAYGQGPGPRVAGTYG
ncbi:FHA domain-containing protein, partial [Streptomyces sp. NPDC057654]|uniref:FHA domain-containing protein n=1 Tax=Streptomyces sp. NPDC057654 TaxID=3346196 RepID=UPI0036AF5FEA